MPEDLTDLLLSSIYPGLVQRGSLGVMLPAQFAGRQCTVHRVMPDGRASFAVDGEEYVLTTKNILGGQTLALDLRERTSRQHAGWRLIESMARPRDGFGRVHNGVHIDLDVDLEHPLAQVSRGRDFWLLDTSCLADLELGDRHRLADGTLRVRAAALKLLCESVWGAP